MSEAARPAGWREGIALYLDRRIATILALGFASGLPSPLVFSNLSIWLRDEGVSRTDIGLFALVATPYAINFLWAPLIDRMPLPGLTDRFGRRRGWALAAQTVLLLALGAMAMTDPSAALLPVAVAALVISTASATQDIVIDAYRVEILEPERYGAGSAAAIWGWHLGGTLVGGAGGLWLAHAFGWQSAYAVLTLAVLVGMGAVLASPEPEHMPPAELEAQERDEALRSAIALRAALRRVGPWLLVGAVLVAVRIFAGPLLALVVTMLAALGVLVTEQASRGGRTALFLFGRVVAPLADFLQRRGAVVILLFIFVFKLGDALLGRMSGVFYRELGFGLDQIAATSKVWGLGATAVGIVLGGFLVARLGTLRALLAGGLAAAATNLIYALLASAGADEALFRLAVVADNFTGGLATVAFVAYLSGLCNLAYTATQYALLASLGNLARIWFSASAGAMVDGLDGDWATFFVFTTVVALLGLPVLGIIMRRYPESDATARRPEQDA